MPFNVTHTNGSLGDIKNRGVVSDMNNVTNSVIEFMKYNEDLNTLNSPRKEGVTSSGMGVAISNFSGGSYGIQFCISQAAPRPFIRTYSKEWKPWEELALKSDFTWKLLGVYDNITSEAKDIATIPHGFTDVLLFAGYPNINNSSQVYGGKSYIIPALESGNNIVYEKELYDADGVETCSGFYAYLTNYTLRARAKKTPIRLRVYYR